jgi:PAS domain S-box-containing protein
MTHGDQNQSEPADENRRTPNAGPPCEHGACDRVTGHWEPGDRRWHSLVAHTPVFILILDRDYRICFANRTQSGAPIGQLVGRSVDDFCRPEERPALHENLRRVFETGQPGVWESRAFRLDNEQRWFAAYAGPVLENGRVAAVSVIATDITARKQLEQTLQNVQRDLEETVRARTAELSAANEQLQIFRMYAEASEQGFGMADLDGYITYWNAALCRMFGEENLENVVGKHLTDYYPISYFELRQNEVLPVIMGGGHWRGEIRIDPPRGKPTYILQDAFLVRDPQGRPFRLAAAVADITDLKRTEELVRQSHDELQAIYDTMGEGMLIADMETLRLLRANKPVCEMLRYSEEELLARSMRDLHPPEALELLVSELSRPGVVRFPSRNDIPMLRSDGSLVYVDLTGNRLTYHGRPCCLGVFRDVTERRTAQAALERERQTLWHMLQASDHERQLIAYEIHDGLTQLLTGAMMQYQAYEHLKTNPEKAKMAFAMGGEMLQMAHAEARRLISGVRPPVLDEAGVETAIAHLVHDRRNVQGPKIEYKSDVHFKRLPRILENALYRIAQEALANACKHSDSDRVRVHLLEEHQKVLFEVQDWGVGFDPDAIPEGHFGLEGIRERVRLLGGRVEVVSAPGQGALVRVELPLVEAAAEGEAQAE